MSTYETQDVIIQVPLADGRVADVHVLGIHRDVNGRIWAVRVVCQGELDVDSPRWIDQLTGVLGDDDWRHHVQPRGCVWHPPHTWEVS